MPRRVTDVVADVHCYCLLKPTLALIPSTVALTEREAWMRHFSEEMWREKQRAGWRVVKVTLQFSPENSGFMPELRRRVTRR